MYMIKVEIYNVDDVIREEKKKLHDLGADIGGYTIYWGEEEYEKLRQFTKGLGGLRVAWGAKHEWMGIHHALDRNITGYVTRNG